MTKIFSFLFIFLGIVIVYIINDFNIIYWSTLIILLTLFLHSNKIEFRLLLLFYIAYFGIGVANISNYRGEISVKTISLYSCLVLLSLIPFLFFKTQKSNSVLSLLPLQRFQTIAKVHLAIVWIFLLLIFILYGNILINQQLRFGVSPAMGYIVKSSLVICLFFPFVQKTNKRSIFLYLVLPILPSIIIGSRGNVISFLICMALIYIIHNNVLSKLLVNLKKVNIRRIGFRLVAVSSIVIIPLFFIRRIFNKSLMQPMEMLVYYKFPSTSWFYLLLLPLHVGFRETIGISNVIINNNYTNDYTPLPLFFQELMTLLPGSHIAPGQVLAKEVIGASLDGGLTPGLLGGTYVDFGVFSVFSGILLTFWIALILRKSEINSFYLIFGMLCLVQYIHLFHRGFLKPEYFTYLVILLVYFKFCQKSFTSNEV